MELVELRDPALLRAWLLRDPGLHLYELGDLDPFFFPRTRWFGLSRGGELDALALLYDAKTPVLLLLEPGAASAELLRRLLPALPPRFYAHLAPGLTDAIAPDVASTISHGRHAKMALARRDLLASVDTAGVDALGPADAQELLVFYARVYPGNWFDPSMLATEMFYGVRETGALASVAGVHVFAPSTRVAALGNVATDPAFRGRGLARKTTARLVGALLAHVDVVGLNVAVDNAPAIACDRGLGFERLGEYDEVMVERAPR